MNAPDSPAPDRPFAVPIFRMVWAASFVASFGSLIQSIGAAWLMTSLTPSPVMVTLVQSSTVFPIMLLALVAGAIADNMDRRKVMIAAQLFMLVMSIGLVACAWAGVLNPWGLLVFTFLIGCGVALNSPSISASTGDMVPRSILPSAVALSSMGFNIARSVGPALGGVIVATAGAAAAFLVNAVSYVGLIAVLFRWKPAYPVRSLPREPLGPAIRSGVRYVAMSPHLRIVMVRAAYFGIFASGASALMPLIVRQILGGGAGVFGLLSAIFGVGAVAGAFLTARLRNRMSAENIVRVATVALAAGTAAAGLSSNVVLTGAAMLVGGAGWVLGLSTFNILVQMASPRWVVGRALACYQMCAFGAMAAGGWIIGETTARIGVAPTLLALAVVQGSNLLAGLVWPVEDVGALDLDPLTQSYEPVVSVPVSPRSGPVIIAVDYRIAPADVPLFLAIMVDYRRVRRRDGAGGWTLMRDLGDAERWIEQFHVPTWVDYLRHIQRRTREDAVIWERLAQLHLGDGRPGITRMLERQPVPPGRNGGERATDPTQVA